MSIGVNHDFVNRKTELLEKAIIDYGKVAQIMENIIENLAEFIVISSSLSSKFLWKMFRISIHLICRKCLSYTERIFELSWHAEEACNGY